MIGDERVRVLADVDVRRSARYVLYWMQQSQRAEGNPALEYAVRTANDLDMAVLVVFALDTDHRHASARHFAFMLEGLAETSAALADRGIKLIVRSGAPAPVVAALAGPAALVVCDRGYLRHQLACREAIVNAVPGRRVVQVEGDVVVPVESASNKREWAARTIRRKLNSRRDDFVRELGQTKPVKSSLPLKVPGAGDLDLRDASLLDRLDVDVSVPPVTAHFRGGTSVARRRLTAFLRNGLEGYASERSDPSTPRVSTMSPYLHFGQISPVEIARRVQRAGAPSREDKEAFLEELIVRRELSVNFVTHTPDYDRYACLPDWARTTLAEHRDDERPVRYTRAQLEAADTHDRYWNAAMREMTQTGYMHNYMRMYWGKKILEWSNTPEYAYRTTLYLNNRYFLDGRDPNSYANVGWIFGLHDRAWTERAVFGKVRYMNAAGLESKFDIDEYVRRVTEVIAAGGCAGEA